MSNSDFLFGGTAPINATTGGTSAQPAFMVDTANNIANRANAWMSPSNQWMPSPVPGVASVTPQMQTGWNQVGQYGQSAQPYMQGALGMVGGLQGPANQQYGQAQGSVQQGMGGLSQANLNQYMNPYLQDVTNWGTQQAMQNYRENIMPQLNAQFIGSGQYGSLGHEAQADIAARNLTTNLAMENQANAANAFTTALGGVQNQQQRELQGGAEQGALAGQQAQTGMNIADTQSGIAGQAQQAGLSGASANTQAGLQQQQQAQNNLDYMNNQWQQQFNWPLTQAQQAAGLVGMMPSAGQQYNTNSPLGYYNSGAQYAPSPMSQTGGTWAGLYGLYGSARGGLARAAKVRKQIPGWLHDALSDALDAHAQAA